MTAASHPTPAPNRTPDASKNGHFQPVIVGFLCNWCSYRAADLAGTSRLGYPPALRDIRIMCTGRLDPTFVLRALERGADGVLIMGCHPGQCHYQDGNYKAIRRFALLRRTLRQFGLEDERVQLHWASAAEGVEFAHTVAAMTEQIRALGPLDWPHVWPEEDRHKVLAALSEGGAQSVHAVHGEPVAAEGVRYE